MSIQELIESFLNGNISDAKKRAEYERHRDLREALIEAGHSEHKAALGADVLKGDGNWQAYCDAE